MSPINRAHRSACAAFSRRWLAPLWLVLGLALSGCALTNHAHGAVVDGVTDWPVALEAKEGRVEVYQPQPEAMKGDKLTARAAVSLARPGNNAATFGAVWFTSRVVTDRDTRTVTLRETTVNDVRVPNSTPAEQKDFARAIGVRLLDAEVTFPLDQLTASLDTAQREEIQEQHINTTPPRIVFSTRPATLISVNGAPKLLPVDGRPGVSRVANTPFILLFDQAGRRYYLKAGARWVSATDLLGVWSDAANVPSPITAAGADLATPATQPSASAASAPTAPELAPAAADAQIIVTTDPTELVVTTGNPQFAPVAGGAGGQLLYASNTASDLFLDQTDEHYYLLLSGRWYSAASLSGPWQFVPSDHLPQAFAQIPSDSPKADVLAFVAGTSEAHEAILDASIPQTANIRRDAGADLTVAYDGEPRFQDVPESPGIAYALNTPEDVLRVNGRYYCCHQGVWYESTSPSGAWIVCTSVPPAIYTLPPSCPAYHVRYVSVYDYSPDYVTCGYLPGYTGTYVYGPTIVYGTGYTYGGWYGTTYFPPPCTWGFGAYYDPFVGAWGFDVGLFWGGIGWFGHPFHDRFFRDHPTERWGWHRWWGPAGFDRAHDIRGYLVDPRATGAFRVADRAAVLAPRMPGTDHRGPGWNNLYSREGNVARNIAVARMRPFTSATPVTTSRENVFAGSDGHVFRKSDTGWQEYRGADQRGPAMVHVPDARETYRSAPGQSHAQSGFARPEAGLDQHAAARSEGAFRSAAIHSFSGGGFHGGGGRGGRR